MPLPKCLLIDILEGTAEDMDMENERNGKATKTKGKSLMIFENEYNQLRNAAYD